MLRRDNDKHRLYSDYGMAADQTYTYSILTQENTTNLLSAPATLTVNTTLTFRSLALSLQHSSVVLNNSIIDPQPEAEGLATAIVTPQRPRTTRLALLTSKC